MQKLVNFFIWILQVLAFKKRITLYIAKGVSLGLNAYFFYSLGLLLFINARHLDLSLFSSKLALSLNLSALAFGAFGAYLDFIKGNGAENINDCIAQGNFKGAARFKRINGFLIGLSIIATTFTGYSIDKNNYLKKEAELIAGVEKKRDAEINQLRNENNALILERDNIQSSINTNQASILQLQEDNKAYSDENKQSTFIDTNGKEVIKGQWRFGQNKEYIANNLKTITDLTNKNTTLFANLSSLNEKIKTEFGAKETDIVKSAIDEIQRIESQNTFLNVVNVFTGLLFALALLLEYLIFSYQDTLTFKRNDNNYLTFDRESLLEEIARLNTALDSQYVNHDTSLDTTLVTLDTDLDTAKTQQVIENKSEYLNEGTDLDTATSVFDTDLAKEDTCLDTVATSLDTKCKKGRLTREQAQAKYQKIKKDIANGLVECTVEIVRVEYSISKNKVVAIFKELESEGVIYKHSGNWDLISNRVDEQHAKPIVQSNIIELPIIMKG